MDTDLQIYHNLSCIAAMADGLGDNQRDEAREGDERRHGGHRQHATTSPEQAYPPVGNGCDQHEPETQEGEKGVFADERDGFSKHEHYKCQDKDHCGASPVEAGAPYYITTDGAP